LVFNDPEVERARFTAGGAAATQLIFSLDGVGSVWPNKRIQGVKATTRQARRPSGRG